MRTGRTGIDWLIDPIDGTTNFLYGLPGWAVSIAAVDDDGPVAGAVSVPTTDELFSAARGHGAHLDGRPAALQHEDRPGHRARRHRLLVPARAPGRAGHGDAALLPRVRDIRRFGAASVDLCSVAGRAARRLLRGGAGPVGPGRGRDHRPRGRRRARPTSTVDRSGPGRWSPARPPCTALPRRCWRRAGSADAARSGVPRNALPIGHDGGVGTRILTVEDDERIRAAVKLALEDEGWTVMESGNGEDAVEQFHRQPADVVLIDLMLPGMDGFELCRSIRRQSDVPIIMVTARNDTHDVVAGLEAGADDYMTKPFVPKELSARIRALLRRARPPQPGHARLAFGDLELIPDEGKVLVAGERGPPHQDRVPPAVRAGGQPGQGAVPGEPAGPGVGIRVLRRRPPGRRPRPAVAHEDRGGSGQPAPRGHGARAGVPAPGLNATSA